MAHHRFLRSTIALPFAYHRPKAGNLTTYFLVIKPGLECPLELGMSELVLARIDPSRIHHSKIAKAAGYARAIVVC